MIPYKFNVGNTTRVFGTLLSYDKNSNDFIVKVYNNYFATLPKDLVPIAIDPAGNLICFDYKKHKYNPIIVFWAHENAEEKEMMIREQRVTDDQAEERARENVFYVAATFTDFLDELHD